MAELLGIDADEDCFLTEKLYHADNALAIYVRDLSLAHIERDPPKDPAASVFEFSKRYCGTPIDHAIAEIVPMVKRDRSVTKLAVKTGEAFIRLHESHYSHSGEASSACSVIDVEDEYIRFQIFRAAADLHRRDRRAPRRAEVPRRSGSRHGAVSVAISLRQAASARGRGGSRQDRDARRRSPRCSARA